MWIRDRMKMMPTDILVARTHRRQYNQWGHHVREQLAGISASPVGSEMLLSCPSDSPSYREHESLHDSYCV